MTPKEIRIGNLVYLDGEVRNVLELSRSENIALGFNYTLCPFDHVKPIGLTEEWLIKFGFKKWQDRLTIESWAKGHPSQRFDIDYVNGVIVMNSRYQSHSDSCIMGHIKYVHQLQNLYFALTGEELTIS